MRYELEMLEPVWPAALKPIAGRFHQFADQLGDDHDLNALRATLQQNSAILPDQHLDALARLIGCRKSELQEKALAWGERLNDGKPKRFARQLQYYWRKWHR